MEAYRLYKKRPGTDCSALLPNKTVYFPLVVVPRLKTSKLCPLTVVSTYFKSDESKSVRVVVVTGNTFPAVNYSITTITMNITPISIIDDGHSVPNSFQILFLCLRLSQSNNRIKFDLRAFRLKALFSHYKI